MIVEQFACDIDTCRQLTTKRSNDIVHERKNDEHKGIDIPQGEASPNDGYVVVVGTTEDADKVAVPFVLAVSVPEPDTLAVPERVPEDVRVRVLDVAGTVTEPVGAVSGGGIGVWAAE